jgi:hypothetical protein
MPYDDPVFAPFHEFAYHRRARYLAGDEQPAGCLRVRQQQGVVVADGREVDLRSDPVEVAAGAAADVSLLQRLAPSR